MQPSDSSHEHMTHGADAGMRSSYSGLFVSIAVSFVVMFGLMYSMADSASNVYFNLSNVYMTGLMAGMIPHHSAAIQMCEESSLSDTRVKKLCDDIITSQRQEIATMKALLAEKQ